MTKIDLITGILGSGKTTFLRRYAKYLLAQGQRIAILENDFGAVNVDMLRTAGWRWSPAGEMRTATSGGSRRS